MGQRFESQFSQVDFGPRKLSKMLITFMGIYTCIKLPPKAKKSVKWKINCEPHPYTVLRQVVGQGVELARPDKGHKFLGAVVTYLPCDMVILS